LKSLFLSRDAERYFGNSNPRGMSFPSFSGASRESGECHRKRINETGSRAFPSFVTRNFSALYKGVASPFKYGTWVNAGADPPPFDVSNL